MGKDAIDGFAAYLNNVSVEDRDKLADEIEQVDIDDYAGITEIAKKGLAAVFRGQLNAETSKEARAWTELMLMAAVKRDQRDNPAGVSPMTNFIAVLQQGAQQPRIEPKYTTVEAIPVKDEKKVG